jgi:hypothetical protein
MKRQVTFDDMKISPAHAARAHSELDFTRRFRWFVPIYHSQWAIADRALPCNDSGAHTSEY